MRKAVFIAGQQQRGFVAIFAAVAMVAMLSAVALAIDIGRLYNAERNLQRAAHLAALDAVQVVSGCTGRGVIGTAAEAQQEATSSLARNGFAAGSVLAEIGMRDAADAQSRFITLAEGDARISAVRVTLTRAAPARLIPGITGNSDLLLQASAAAEQAPQAGISLGTTVLGLNSANSPLLNSLLGGLLGGDVSLSIASQRGLAGAQVHLGDLAAAAGVATPSGLGAVSTTLPGMLNLLADALNATGGAANTAAAVTLNTLAAIADPSRNVLLGDVLVIGSQISGSAADTAYVDALSLLTALAQSAVVGQPLNLPLTVALPAGLANLRLMLKVVQAPKIIGPGPAGTGSDGQPLTFARTAAMQLQVRTDLLDISGALSALSPLVGVVAQPIHLGIDIDLAAAEASVRSIQCAARNRPDTVVDLDVDTQLVRLTLGTFAGAAASLPPLSGGALISAINLPIIGPVLSVNLTAPAVLDIGTPDTEQATFINDFPLYVPLPTLTNPRQVGDVSLLGSAGASLASQFASRLNVKLLGASLPVGNVLTLASSLLAPVFDLLDGIVDPLLVQLGVQAGATNVELFQVSVPQAEVFNSD